MHCQTNFFSLDHAKNPDVGKTRTGTNGLKERIQAHTHDGSRCSAGAASTTYTPPNVGTSIEEGLFLLLKLYPRRAAYVGRRFGDSVY